ncbi:hypothetical protein L8R85_02100 [Vibrio splendidus]|uniref:Uncharacterized protein n=1 Tax=Vibrio splendidus TaxID=29497 RepID=A0AA43FUY1_VIBSP|nr:MULTISPECIES: hypothetical protein [Vibrio]MDH5919809.1 hypothetical protein [Vibrio splendidus]MDH5951294.1 hypothetical protein [Vibrio crassostreae]TCT46259.1 hypothetical protein EDB39_114132 [Vibrio crassostreae]TCT54120.1 hypothetical protein EDB40_1146 [Vibrio crassostreae]TCT58999.1 hypothetical protein EDB44_118135 [Vibrio crassostreae]
MDYSTLLDNLIFLGHLSTGLLAGLEKSCTHDVFCCASDTGSTQRCADDSNEVRTPKTLTLKLSCRIYSPF